MISFLIFAQLCYFLPPDGWECVRQEKLSTHIQVGFLGKGDSPIRPSLNLAAEPTDLSLKDYVKAVKEIHKEELHLAWRDLGEFSCRAGKGRIGEITSTSPLGELKILQAILVRNQTAYILTAAAHKDDFAKSRPLLLEALRSLSLADDLFAPIANPDRQNALRGLFSSFSALEEDAARKRAWESLQKTVLEEHRELGAYWHFLALQEGYQKIFTPKTGQKDSSP